MKAMYLTMILVTTEEALLSSVQCAFSAFRPLNDADVVSCQLCVVIYSAASVFL